LLALARREPGAEAVDAAIVDGAAMSAVNLGEVVAKMRDSGMPEPSIRESLTRLDLEIVPFDAELAFQSGFLRPATRSAGLSFGDRACIALGQALRVPVLTTDRTWGRLSLDVEIRVVR
jgi:ribonuclease VapC